MSPAVHADLTDDRPFRGACFDLAYGVFV